MEDLQTKLRAIPSIDRLLTEVKGKSALTVIHHEVVVKALRQATAMRREQLLANKDVDCSPDAILELTARLIKKMAQPNLKRVINATGVVLHTNLGRAPLSRHAIENLNTIMAGYCNLEYDLETGERGSRYAHITGKLCELTGAEAALVVNNNAAAVLLVLTALAAGQEVIVSRGQLVEIGGSFRIPDVLRQSGATLVEVGTTNKTHLYDYERAIGPRTAAIMKVHTSNYRVVGFTSEVDDRELIKLASEHNIPIIEDLGSGSLLPIEISGWNDPVVRDKITAGFDVATFSGDKLLGAGQAGLIVGRKKYIEQLKKQPLLRALRIDKLSLAALEGSLLDYELGVARGEIPVLRMLTATPSELLTAATSLAGELSRIPGWNAEVIPLQSYAGGGALPEIALNGYGVRLNNHRISSGKVEEALRKWTTPIIARINDDCIILDVRCLTGSDTQIIYEACVNIGEGVPQ